MPRKQPSISLAKWWRNSKVSLDQRHLLGRSTLFERQRQAVASEYILASETVHHAVQGLLQQVAITACYS